MTSARERLSHLLASVEALHIDGAADAARPPLARASHLLECLQALEPELRGRPDQAEWDELDAVTLRTALDVYTRAVRELRAVAIEARARVESAEGTLVDGRLRVKRARRLLGKKARVLTSWR